MPVLWIVGIALGFFALLALPLFVIRPRSASLRPGAVAEAVGLPLTPEVEQMITSTQRRQVRTIVASTSGAIVLASIGMLVARVSDPGQMFWIDFTAIVAASGVASTIATLAREDNRQKGQVRIARLRAVVLSDYRSPFDQWAPRIVVLAAILALVVRALQANGGPSAVPALVYGYVALTAISLAIGEIGSRMVIRSGQPAGTELELAWDDALKSRALATLVVAPFYLGAYFGTATVALYPLQATGLTPVGALAQLAVTVVAMSLLIVSALQSVANKQRYLRRLWPDMVGATATGAVRAAPAPQS